MTAERTATLDTLLSDAGGGATRRWFPGVAGAKLGEGADAHLLQLGDALWADPRDQARRVGGEALDGLLAGEDDQSRRLAQLVSLFLFEFSPLPSSVIRMVSRKHRIGLRLRSVAEASSMMAVLPRDNQARYTTRNKQE